VSEPRRVLVTGASRGIGLALADALRARGDEVIGTARTATAGCLACDVRDDAQVRALAARVGPVDVLVNNAAVIHDPAPLVDVPLAEWLRVLETNLVGMVAMLRAFVPEMNRRGSGIVVNVSSTWGRSAAALQAPYCASKFAVEGLTRSLAAEVAAGVCVVAVNPGVVDTGMLATAFSGRTEGATPPDACARRFVRLLEAVGERGPRFHGRSLDVDSF